MNNTKRNLKISLVCASLMLLVGATVQLFSFQTQRQTTALMDALEQNSAYVITNTGEDQACASVKTGQVLWECKSGTCSRQETLECLKSTETLSAFAEDEEQLPAVAGVYDVVNPEQCKRPGVGYAGQSGCWSKRKLSVVGSPRFYTLDSSGNALDAGQFTKAAHNDLSDKWRQYDVSKGEVIRWAVPLKNNSSTVVTDNYMFSVGKITEAPKGNVATSQTPLCEAQLNELNKLGNMTQVSRTIFSGKQYTIAGGQQKLLYGEWKPTNNDCGLYQIDLGAADFQGSEGKTQCANPTGESVIGASFVRVVGCNTTGTPAPLSCSGAVFKKENGSSIISSAKPGEYVSLYITLSKSPVEINATESVYVYPELGNSMEYYTYIYPQEPTHRCTNNNSRVECVFDKNAKDKILIIIAKVKENVSLGSTITLPIKVMYKGVDVTNGTSTDIARNNCRPSLSVNNTPSPTISCTKTFYTPVKQADGTYRIPATMRINATGGIPANLNVKDSAQMYLAGSPTSYSGSITSLLPQINNFSCKDLGKTYPGQVNNQVGFSCAINPLSFSNSQATYNYGFVVVKGSDKKETLKNDIGVYSGETKLADCTSSVEIPEKQSVTSCEYKYSDWVEQYRTDHATQTDKNSPKLLSLVIIPQGNAQKVRIIYEYLPLRDTTSENVTGIPEFSKESNPARCAPQANEEALMYLATENALNRQITAVHRFADNKIADGFANPDVKLNKILEFSLNPGLYSLNARWAGDGLIYCTRDANINSAACKANGQNILGEFIKDPTYKYKADLTNPASPMITYDTAIKESPKYGPLCKWSGSYKVRAGWCIVTTQAPNTPTAQVQTLELTLSNPAMLAQTAVEIYVNGSKQTLNGSSSVALPPRQTKVIRFNYLNSYPERTLVEVKAVGSNSKLTKLNVLSQGKAIYTSVTPKDVTPEGAKYEYTGSASINAN